jgi:23S rRNA pseudouridine1911/1915/1917 synthase
VPADRDSSPSVPTRLVVLPQHDGTRLDQFLAAATDLSRRAARRAISDGLVWRNSDPVRVQSKAVVAGDVVEVLLAATELGVAAKPDHPVPVIVHEDRWLVVADKPAGMLCQPSERSEDELALDQRLLVGLAARDGQRPFLRLVHRIDRLTSGAVLFARNPQALKPLTRAWADGSVDRRYLAVVTGHPAEDRWVIDKPIGRDPDHHWRFQVADGGKPARTELEVVTRHDEGTALVRCRLLTGRTHQVRVHLAAVGHPVVGDRLYGAPPTAGVNRPLLHAASLTFPHPRTGDELTVETEVPGDMVRFVKAE